VLSDFMMSHFESRATSTVASLIAEVRPDSNIPSLRLTAAKLGLTGLSKLKKDELMSRIRSQIGRMQIDESLRAIAHYQLRESITNTEITSSSSILDPAVAPDETSLDEDMAVDLPSALEQVPNTLSTVDTVVVETPTQPIAMEAPVAAPMPATPSIGSILMGSPQTNNKAITKEKPKAKKAAVKKTGKRAAPSSWTPPSSQEADGDSASPTKKRKITDYFAKTPSSSSLDGQPTQSSSSLSGT
jgi:hypothetical protein